MKNEFMADLDKIHKQAKKEARTMKYNDTGYTPTAICGLYDRNPNLTLAELSDITGRTVAQLKRILMGASK